MNDVGEPNVMLHTQAEYVPKIMQHVEHLYKAATDAALSDANALKNSQRYIGGRYKLFPTFVEVQLRLSSACARLPRQGAWTCRR